MNFSKQITVILIIGVLVIGCLSTWLIWDLTESRLEKSVLSQAKLVAHSVNTHRLEQLKGNLEDLKSADYHRLKEQLKEIRKSQKNCRFLYIMGQKSDGTVFFYLDSQPPDSEDYAPPGLIYEEVPEEYLHTFKTGGARTVGPVSDRWGTLISSLVPVYSPKSNRLIGVLGMDIDATDWSRRIFFNSLLPMILTFFVVFLVILILIFSKNHKSENQQSGFLAFFLVAIIVLGSFLTWYTWINTTNQLKESSLEQARIVAQSINLDRLQSLKGDLSDLSNPNYLRVKEQLYQIRQTHSTCRFLYLMGRKPDGTVFFFLDSQPSTSKDYAPPGLAYEEVSEEYLHTFKTGKQRTVGPITDRWGTLVTSLIPLFDKQSNKLIAVLGMDTDAKDWNEKIIMQCFLPLGLTVFIIFLTFSLYIVLRNRQTIKAQAIEIEKKHADSNRLLHILCHDLANPIGNLRTLLQNLKRNPSQIDPILNLSQQSADNAVKIIKLIRNIQSLEERKESLELEHITLKDLIEESCIMLEMKFQSKKINLQVDIPEQLTVKVERTSFVNSVINNLLTNAIKFSYADSDILIKAETKGSQTKLVIQDFGIGIPQNILDDIFDLTKKTSRPGTDGEQGTGFGMPLVKRFVEEYSGSIQIESKIKSEDNSASGTTVTLLLSP